MNVAIYLRVANANQLDDGPMKNQENILRQYAKEHAYNIVASFQEYGSANSQERPALKTLIEMPAATADGILVRDLSRIHRSIPKFFAWFAALQASGKKLISVENGVIPENAANEIQQIALGLLRNKGKSKKA